MTTQIPWLLQFSLTCRNPDSFFKISPKSGRNCFKDILHVDTHRENNHRGHKAGEKNSPSFPGFSRAINVLFHRLPYQAM